MADEPRTILTKGIFMKMICLLSLVLFLTSCKTGPKSKICNIALAATNQVAVGISSALQCRAVAKIAEDLQTPVRNTKICAEKETLTKSSIGIIGMLVCPPVAKFITKMANGKIPLDWECSAAAEGGKLEAIVKDACLSVTDSTLEKYK